MTTDLTRLDEWFGRILQGLSPADRRRAALKLGQALRRSTSSASPPTSTPTAPPSPRARPATTARAACAPSRGKMFQGLRYAKHWRIDADEDGVELSPPPVAARMAAVSQFGETVTVGRLRNGQRIRARYPERRLLGFYEDDEGLASKLRQMIEPDCITQLALRSVRLGSEASCHHRCRATHE
jgi:hypothetical protein